MIQQILDFWFAGLGAEDPISGDRMQLWFMKNPEMDAKIKADFGDELQAAALGDREDWKATPEGKLAWVILLDQFSRNIYRGDPKSWSQDALCRQTVLDAIDAGEDLKLIPIHRGFFYLPLEHAEDKALQELSVQKYTDLANSVGEAQKSDFNNFLDYAKAHKVIIDRFGRFPHRNDILGRTSTPEEIEFLKQPGSSF